MFPGLQEPLDMGQENVTRREKACTQPQQLPAFLFTVSAQEETQEEKKITRGMDTSDLLCPTQSSAFGPSGTKSSYLMWLSVSCLRVWQ